MENLPPELLERVFMYLPPRDRMESALTCRRWAKIMSSSSLLEDVWLKARGCKREAFEAALIRSKRQYRNLQISRADLSTYSPELWGEIGSNLRNLEILDCDWSPRYLYDLLRNCEKLESLRISFHECLWASRRGDPFEGLSFIHFELPRRAWAEEIRKSRCDVEQPDFLMGADVFQIMLNIMPNIKSPHLSRFAESRNLLELIPSLLGPGRVITELDLFSPILRRKDLIQLVRASSASLRKFRYRGTHFTLELFEAVCKCTELRSLSLPRLDFRFDDNHLEKLLLKAEDLESLELHSYQGLTAESLFLLREHKKLRKLGLVDCGGVLNGLGEISTLQSLNLRGTAIDVRTLQGLARLPNLRELSVDCTHMTSEGLEVIFENFKNLDALDIINCDELSDADGIKIRRLEKLKSLNIENSFRFTDLTFENGLGSAALESLRLRRCSLTDVGLASIAAHHNCLKTLALNDCRNVTDDGLVALLRSEPRLEELEVVGSIFLLTEDVLETLLVFCPRIRVLRISDCCHVSEDDMDRFEERRPGVEVTRVILQ